MTTEIKIIDMLESKKILSFVKFKSYIQDKFSKELVTPEMPAKIKYEIDCFVNNMINFGLVKASIRDDVVEFLVSITEIKI